MLVCGADSGVLMLVDKRCSTNEEMVVGIALGLFAGSLIVATSRSLEALRSFVSEWCFLSGAMMRLWIIKPIQEKVWHSSRQQFLQGDSAVMIFSSSDEEIGR